jgi:hypothetical protein
MIHIERIVVGLAIILFMAVMIFLVSAPLLLAVHYNNALFMLGYLLPAAYCIGAIE